MLSLSTCALMGTAFLTGAAAYGLAHFWPRYRHRHARDLDWLQRQTPYCVRGGGGLWYVTLPDGRPVFSKSRAALEQRLSAPEQ